MKQLWILAAVMLVISCKRGEPVDLKMNLQPGDKYLYTMVTSSTMDQGMMGKVTDKKTMESLYEVAAAGVNKRITVTFQRVAMQTGSGDRSMAYDSKTNSGSPEMAAVVKNMLGRPFSLLVSDKGEILEISGIAEIINGVGDTTTKEGVMNRKMMISIFNETAIKNMMEQSLSFFPGHSVRPGETWKSRYDFTMSVMNMEVDNDYTLRSVKDGIAYIDVNSKITGSGAMSDKQMQSVQLEVGGTQKGTMEVEVATGLIRDSELQQNVDGNISAMGMKMPIRMQQDTHISAERQ
jgi:hypothetical protein